MKLLTTIRKALGIKERNKILSTTTSDNKPIQFILDSDFHFGNEKNHEKNNAERIVKEIQNPENNIRAVICPGDLTDHGWDGKKVLGWRYGGKKKELREFKDRYLKPLETTKVPVYLSNGNHDHYVPRPYLHKGVSDLVRKRHGHLRYAFDIQNSNQSLHFICLDVYPDKKGIQFLQKELKKNKDKNMVVYFHYNLQGEWSDWWQDAEKAKFLETIEPYRQNIKAIMVGHQHKSKEEVWQGFKVITGAGKKFALCTLDQQTSEVNVQFR